MTNALHRASIGLLLVTLAGTASASAARTVRAPPSALPDWSGVWENVSGIHFTQPQGGGKNLAPNPPPLNADYAARYGVVVASSKAGKPVNDPTANCVWPGTPRVIASPFPSEFLFTPGRVTIVYEYMSQVRRIRTDGSGHPADLDPSYNGDSIGHWEGKGADKTLVVDTVGLRGDTMYENTGLPHSDALHMVERIHLAGPNALVDEMTFTDPKALTQPWTATWHYKRHHDWTILDYVCEENNRNPNIGGVTVVR